MYSIIWFHSNAGSFCLPFIFTSNKKGKAEHSFYEERSDSSFATKIKLSTT